ncbi:MAG: hypothetical protein HOC23_03185 [Halieaceae bacterium]|jgi:hypothetical protein|nr:hypothetical protein [Halieaceae bacterium]
MKLIALVFLAAAIIYHDAGDNLFYNLLLPILGLMAFVYLFTLPGSLIIASGAVIFYFIDFSSSSLFRSLVLPLLFGANIIWFIFWAYSAGHLAMVSAGGADGAGIGGGGGDCGGDGGGC